MHFLRLLASLSAAAILAGCASTSTTSSSSTGIRLSDVNPNILEGRPTGSNRLGLNSPNDIWDRVRAGFTMPDLDSYLVRDREAWYTRNPASITRLIDRSNKYIYHVVEELERRNMPTELALLPFVESAFNPHAVSSAQAAGLWQFIPSTGRYYSLEQNRFQDDRRDIQQSTRAALDYLQRLYGMFGDWHLALAAYNWGEGNVQRAVNRNLAAGRPAGYMDINMPQETRQYVPKLQALKNIIRNPHTFDTKLPNVANRPYFGAVPIKRDIDVAQIARLAGITEDDFRSLNPSLNKPVVIAAINRSILLPMYSIEQFRRNLDEAKNQQLSSWRMWRVPRGMTLAEVATEVGSTESELRRVNRIPPRRMVRAGSSLMVPRVNPTDGDISSTDVRTASLNLAPESVALRTPSVENVVTVAQQRRSNSEQHEEQPVRRAVATSARQRSAARPTNGAKAEVRSVQAQHQHNSKVAAAKGNKRNRADDDDDEEDNKKKPIPKKGKQPAVAAQGKHANHAKPEPSDKGKGKAKAADKEPPEKAGKKPAAHSKADMKKTDSPKATTAHKGEPASKAHAKKAEPQKADTKKAEAKKPAPKGKGKESR